MDKAGLRQHIQENTRKISAADKAKENTMIFDTRQKELLPGHTNRAVYISLLNEVDTKKIIETILSSGKKCLLPIQQEDNFFFTEITNKTQYQKNKYGILEPINTQQAKQKPDVILVPGLAFTKQWTRLWRWLWRYDKLLSQYPDIIKIGLCFESQIIPNIPIQAHDQDMDIILSTQLYFTS